MLLETSLCIAVKEREGKYNIANINIFQIGNVRALTPSLKISIDKNKNVFFKVLCPFCNESHLYKHNVSEIIKKDMLIGGCPILGFPLIYIGNYKYIKEKTEIYNLINSRMLISNG